MLWHKTPVAEDNFGGNGCFTVVIICFLCCCVHPLGGRAVTVGWRAPHTEVRWRQAGGNKKDERWKMTEGWAERYGGVREKRRTKEVKKMTHNSSAQQACMHKRTHFESR